MVRGWGRGGEGDGGRGGGGGWRVGSLSQYLAQDGVQHAPTAFFFVGEQTSPDTALACDALQTSREGLSRCCHFSSDASVHGDTMLLPVVRIKQYANPSPRPRGWRKQRGVTPRVARSRDIELYYGGRRWRRPSHPAVQEGKQWAALGA